MGSWSSSEAFQGLGFCVYMEMSEGGLNQIHSQGPFQPKIFYGVSVRS